MSYFDAERIAENPDRMFLSQEGEEAVLEWIDLLAENGYYPFEHRLDIYDAAGWLIANGHSEVGIDTTLVVLAFIA